jgi:hypothetical protein
MGINPLAVCYGSLLALIRICQLPGRIRSMMKICRLSWDGYNCKKHSHRGRHISAG